MANVDQKGFLQLKKAVEKLAGEIKQLKQTPTQWYRFELKTPIKLSVLPGAYADISKMKGKVLNYYTVKHEIHTGADEDKTKEIEYTEIEIHSFFTNQNPGWHDLEFGPIIKRIASDSFVEQTPIY